MGTNALCPLVFTPFTFNILLTLTLYYNTYMGTLNDAYIKAKELIARKGRDAQDDGVDVNERNEKQMNRLPPGQRLVNNFPVLDLGYRPIFFEKKYRFEVTGLVENPIKLTWQEFKELPKVELTADFHCVTRWSKFDVKWCGVLMKDIIELVKPKAEAKFFVQYGTDGYTTNVPLEKVMTDTAILAYELDGKPLPREHGGPLRMIIPELYAWKGSKFLTKLEFLGEDELGFWEIRGYNNSADPWKEERYA
jgi:DMSO/TMAO reductase YedYZ molybdopterin-dependent catalytic subunit